MSTSTSLNIHPELRSIRSFKMPMDSLRLRAIRTLVSFGNALHRRKFKSIVTRTQIPSFDSYAIPALIIRPENLPAMPPALVYYHGGAFVMKPAPQHFENAVRYAREANCLVVFIEYRLAPDYPFPAGFNDCYAALRWTLTNAEKLGIDKNRIAIGGDSAGGGMAASVAQRARQEDSMSLCGQMLVYPAVDLNCHRSSMDAFANVPPFKEHSINDVAQAYLGHPVSAGMPHYASALSGDVSGVASAYVETVEFDVLHDQGNAYAQAMIEKGVPVELNEIKGGVHGFDLLAANSSVAKEVMKRRIQFLRGVFGE